MKSINVDITFKNCKRRNEGNIVRRAKKKCHGGEIGVPVDVTVQKLKEILGQKIMNGEYTIGELVVPKKFKKMVLKNGNIENETFTVESRKISLTSIRRRMVEKHEKYMRCQNGDSLPIDKIIIYLKKINEFILTDTEDTMRRKFTSFQLTRHLQLWHDASSLDNHGYMLFTVNALYDPAVYYTDDEFMKNTGKKINVQNEIEKPELYIVGMSLMIVS